MMLQKRLRPSSVTWSCKCSKRTFLAASWWFRLINLDFNIFWNNVLHSCLLCNGSSIHISHKLLCTSSSICQPSIDIEKEQGIGCIMISYPDQRFCTVYDTILTNLNPNPNSMMVFYGCICSTLSAGPDLWDSAPNSERSFIIGPAPTGSSYA